mgnify:CR=1 FL=1
MSLEQLRGASNVDARADIYSLSVMLYECLAGVIPFSAATLGDLVFAICSAPPLALDTARHLIDVLGMLEHKTRGNLDESEQKLLQSLIYDLRVAFVDASARARPA